MSVIFSFFQFLCLLFHYVPLSWPITVKLPNRMEKNLKGKFVDKVSRLLKTTLGLGLRFEVGKDAEFKEKFEISDEGNEIGSKQYESSY